MRSAVTEIREISVVEISVAAGDLTHAHWQEVGREKDLMVLDPDWPRYEAMERAGAFLTLGVFDGDQLVGYSMGAVAPHLHYRGVVVYMNDALYLAPSHRRSRLGVDLIEQTEAVARERGAKWFSWHAKPGTALDRLLSKRGYQTHDIIYARRAKDV